MSINPQHVSTWNAKMVFREIDIWKSKIEHQWQIKNMKQAVRKKKITGKQLDECSTNDQQMLMLFSNGITDKTAKLIRLSLRDNKFYFEKRTMSKMAIENNDWKPQEGEKILCIDNTGKRPYRSLKATIKQVLNTTIKIGWDAYPDPKYDTWIRNNEWAHRITILSKLNNKLLRKNPLPSAVKKISPLMNTKSSLNSYKNTAALQIDQQVQPLKQKYNKEIISAAGRDKLEQKYSELKQTLLRKETEHKQRINELKQKYNEQNRKQNVDWLDKQTKYKQQINELTQELCNKNDEIAQQREEMQQLEQKYNEQIKSSYYLTWNSQHIADWIISINPVKYKKYYEKLKNCMKKESIDGTCLEDLDKNDLHRCGITAFKDKQYIYNSLQDIIKKTKRIKEIENTKLKTWIHKSISKWSTDDVLQWLISLKLPDQVYYKIAFEIEENSECNGEDIISLNSIQDVSNAFGINNNENLCNQIFEEIKKLQQQLQSECDTEQKDENKLITKINDNTFRINIFSQGKYMVLHQKVTKEITIQSIKNMYKQQSGVEANIDDIHFYSKSKLLSPNNTLRDFNIIDDKNLITVRFGVDGADAVQ